MTKPGRSFSRVLRRMLLALAAAIVLWLGGFILFTRDLPMSVNDETMSTDAIVVLTGGSERLTAGLDLLRRGLGRKLLVSGVYRGVEVAELMRIMRGSPADFDCCVVLGYDADDTRGNAMESAAWMEKEGFTTLRLVTASYHMPRSLVEFRRLLPKATIVPHPVFPDRVKHDEWWRWPGTTLLYVREYNKYLLARLRAAVDDLLGTGTPA